jgi:hypothetical protein
MSELDDLRAENKQLKRLLGNALELLEKSKRALTKQAQSQPGAVDKKDGIRRGNAKTARKKTANKSKAKNVT